MMAVMSAKEAPSLPYNQPEFFDRFKIDQTILTVTFVKEEQAYVPGRPKNTGSKFLAKHNRVGFYGGRQDGGLIRIASFIGSVDIIPASHIRGVKTENIQKVRAIVSECMQAVLRVDEEADVMTIINALNELRRSINRHPILIPRERIA